MDGQMRVKTLPSLVLRTRAVKSYCKSLEYCNLQEWNKNTIGLKIFIRVLVLTSIES